MKSWLDDVQPDQRHCATTVRLCDGYTEDGWNDKPHDSTDITPQTLVQEFHV